MKYPSFFLTKTFWILFTIAVIIGLYLYGLKMIGDKTEIAQTKKALQTKEQELASCTIDNNSNINKIEQLNKTISEQRNTITEQSNIISQKETTISGMQNRITELENRPPQIVTKIQERTVYKPAPEPYHEFGKGNGKITIFSTYGGDRSSLSIWIDGVFEGVFDTYQSNRKSECGAIGAFNKIVAAGKHHVIAKDQLNKKWESDYIIAEDQCRWIRLR